MLVKRSLVKIPLVLCCALAAMPTFAQSAAQPRSSAETAKTQTAAANVKTARSPLLATVTAAGSVIVLADGIIANAALAQIQPPADGFVYER
jgi:hypothetical protein